MAPMHAGCGRIHTVCRGPRSRSRRGTLWCDARVRTGGSRRSSLRAVGGHALVWLADRFRRGGVRCDTRWCGLSAGLRVVCPTQSGSDPTTPARVGGGRDFQTARKRGSRSATIATSTAPISRRRATTTERSSAGFCRRISRRSAAAATASCAHAKLFSQSSGRRDLSLEPLLFGHPANQPRP